MKLIISLAFVFLTFYVKSQDTITVMAYNVLNYPLTNATKADTLKAIIKHTTPDIFLITELTSSSGVGLILNNALNVAGVTSYQSATYMNGPDTDNMLFYNSSKLVLKSQFEIPTTLRNISEYVLYYKNGALTFGSDTVFIHCYMAHLKAGNSTSDSIQRNQEAVIFKNYLESKAQPIENIVFGGDFNVYTSAEAAYNTILNGGSIPLFDPINVPGNWNNNASYKNVHTQSTRTTSIGDGGATGGLDDRFDFLLVGGDLMSGTNKLKYVNNTYKSVGNDGNHFNKAINLAPNTVVPVNVADALYYMSDHLPVIMKLYYDETLSIKELIANPKWKGYFANNNFIFKSINKERLLNVYVYDVVGKLIQNHTINGSETFEINLLTLTQGLYFINVVTIDNQETYRIIKH